MTTMKASIEAHHYLKSGFDYTVLDYTVLDFTGASASQIEAATSHLDDLANSGRQALNKLIVLGR